MSTTEQRLAASRANGAMSSGPSTIEGKAIASRNATRHGLLSGRMFLQDECPAEFSDLYCEFCNSLKPGGAVEETLVERIAITVWRQRRLVRSETATIELLRLPKKVAGGVSAELGRGYGAELKQEELEPFDAERADWSRKALAEMDALESLDLATLEKEAPLVFEQLKSDAEEDQESPTKFIAERNGGLATYLAELSLWCREQLRHADARPHIMAVADQVRSKRVILPADQLELFARYQTTLDNQMFKLLRALREAQEWRLKTLTGQTAPEAERDAAIAEAA